MKFRLHFQLRLHHRQFMAEPRTPWPHAPTHQLSGRGTYFATASTYQKAHHFRRAKRLRILHRGLLAVAEKFGWKLEAWAVFSKPLSFHRPFARRCQRRIQLERYVEYFARQDWRNGSNKLDKSPGRQVWFNFRETRLHATTLVSGVVELCSSKRGEARACAGGQPVSMVLGGVV